MKKIFGLFGLVAMLGIGVHAANTPTAALLSYTTTGGYAPPISYTVCDPFNVTASLVAQNLTLSGNATVAGNLNVTGSVTGGSQNGTNETLSGIQVFSPQVIVGISSTTSLTPTSTYVQVLSSAAFVTLGGATGNAGQAWYAPISTASAVPGQLLIIYSTSPTSYVVISTATTGTAASNGTWASATTVSTQQPSKVLQFIFDGVDQAWREIHD